jgi:hypothetical protein
MLGLKARVATGALALSAAFGIVSVPSAYAINETSCVGHGLLQIWSAEGRDCFANAGGMYANIDRPNYIDPGANSGHIVVYTASGIYQTIRFNRWKGMTIAVVGVITSITIQHL